MKTKRLLSYHFPELEQHENLSLGVSFAQIADVIQVDESGIALSSLEIEEISIHAYRTPSYRLYRSFNKPVSRVFDMSNLKINRS